MKRLCIFISLLVFVPGLFASAAGSIRAGNRHFKKGHYDKSLEKYREAEIASPNNPVVHFNIGDALYKSNGFDESTMEFQRAIAVKDPRVRSRAYYNLGNAAFRSQKTDEALEYYKKALDIDPSDMDAKYNIEYILNRKNTQQKSKDSKENKNSKDKKDSKQNEQSGKSGQGKEKDSRDKTGISKEDAQRILQYYNESDKNAAQKRKMMLPQLPKVEEDW